MTAAVAQQLKVQGIPEPRIRLPVMRLDVIDIHVANDEVFSCAETVVGQGRAWQPSATDRWIPNETSIEKYCLRCRVQRASYPRSDGDPR